MLNISETPGDRRLSDLFAGIAPVEPSADRPINGLALDSRAVRTGDLFFACQGSRTHGCEYVAEAVAAGAVAVACAPDVEDRVRTTLAARRAASAVAVVVVEDLRRAVGLAADRFYGHPSRAMHVIGVTGTNGKTSCTQFLAQALSRMGESCAVIGTLGAGTLGQQMDSGLTTPDALALHKRIAEFRDRGVRRLVMEVSSHALDQERIAGVAFDAAVFTNLSRDHLDYHGDMSAYGLAKRRLFFHSGLNLAVINADDAFGRELLDALPDTVEAVAYTLQEETLDRLSRDGTDTAVLLGRVTRHDRTGLQIAVSGAWGEGEFSTPMLGRPNAANLLAVLATLLALGVNLREALAQLARLEVVPGRMEAFLAPRRPLIIVDYAHTPDALEGALHAVREHCRGQVWVVFGCGGDRDRGKRRLMGEVAERRADHVVLTDDNPRSEDPAAIVADIASGMRAPQSAVRLADRGAAIAYAIDRAAPGDAVLVAGKGHESYQIVGDERRPFSDRETVARLLEGAA